MVASKEFRKVPLPPDLQREIPLTENARTVLRKRYIRKNEDGTPAETEEEMFWRVAYHVALADKELGKTEEDVETHARKYYDLLTTLRFFPNSPTFTGAGTPLGQLAACFSADMRVTTEQGMKRIADLQIGDRVLTHEGRYRPVTELFQRAYRGELLRIKLPGTTLEVTPEHPILTPDGWVKAGELKVSDKVAVAQEIPAPVYAGSLPDASPEHDYSQIDEITAELFNGTVYNCEVEDDHSYVTEGVVVHNCFVLPIEDDMGRTQGGIFQTLRDAALIQQTGGGNGFAFSRLRPRGAIVKSSNGAATGPVGFLRVYDQAFGEIAQGGCLTPDTLIFTSKGLLRLDEMIQHDAPGWMPHEYHVSTDEGIYPSYQGYNNGISPVLKIKTDAGIELTGTPNHKIQVMTENGVVWKHFEELQPGDALMVKLGQHMGEMQTLVQPKKQHGNQVMPTFPDMLDEEFAFFIGYLMGDGFIAAGEDDKRIGVAVAHSSYLIEEMPALMRRLFGEHLNIHVQQKENDASVTFIIDNRALKNFFLMNGIEKACSTAVCVPRLIRQSPPHIVGAFLRGLFEADGALSHGYPQLISSSETLIRETATLLIGLGCPVRISKQASSDSRYGRAQLWNLRVHCFTGLKAWQKWIGCDEKSRFSACQSFIPDLSRETSYTLPFANYWINPVLNATTMPQVDKRGRGMGKNLRSTQPSLRRRLLRYSRGDRQLTLSGYQLLREEFVEFAENAHPVNNLWFVYVESVEDAGESLTLDFEVAEVHKYLANGLAVSNSRRGANMAVLRVDHPDIRDFIQCKAVEGAIENFNISVGITDTFMKAVEEDTTYDLINPQDGKVWETVRAREIFDMIVEHAHRNGEPGVLFLDTANRENPVPHLYELESTNPCVTGDTLIFTSKGLRRAQELFDDETAFEVVIDGRFGVEQTTVPATRVFRTGTKPVYRLQTKEGYYVRATADHCILTRNGWIELQHLNPGDEVHILNRKGAFGSEGSLEEGRVLGWLVGDGTVNEVRAVLSFFGEEKRELAPVFAGYVNNLVSPLTQRTERAYPVAPSFIEERDEARIQSERLRIVAEKYGLTQNKHQVSDAIFAGNEAMQRGFLQALFTADGSFQDGGSKGGSVRLAANEVKLLEQVQLLLLNFGIASRIYRNRRDAGYRNMPDSEGSLKLYWCEVQHELVISKVNMAVFAREIGFLMNYKQASLENYISRGKPGPYKEHFFATVESITEDGIEDVFDLTEPVTHSFIGNGVVLHNCGEQFLGDYENCCLGSINLAQHYTNSGEVDWEKLRESIDLSTRFLDHVITANAYVPSVPQLKEAAERVRRIGLGIMGLGDMMYAVGVRYGSPEGQEFASQIMEFVRYHAMKTGIELAKEYGAFPAIEGSRYDPNNLKWTIPQPLVPHVTDWKRPKLDWKKIERDLKKHGIRNGAQLTCAPTGTISTVSGCEGYGCEPVFALAYIRYVVNNAGNSDDRIALQYTSPLFEKALQNANLSGEQIKAIVEKVNVSGTCQHIPEVPEEIRNVFVVASDITAEEHIRMQAAMQAFVDNALSKTINMSNTAKLEDVAQAYLLGWKLGCKGLTVYVTGSREKVVLETKETLEKKKKQEESEQIDSVSLQQVRMFNEDKKPRPRRLEGKTYRTETPAGTTYVTINENGEGPGQPFEVFIHTGKVGSEVMAIAEAMGRLVSYLLRLSSPVSPYKRLQEVVKQLKSIGGDMSMGFGPNRVRSLPDGLSQVFEEYLYEMEELAKQSEQEKPHHAPQQPRLIEEKHIHTNGTKATKAPMGDLCPECGSATLVYEEGCAKCYSCGYSRC